MTEKLERLLNIIEKHDGINDKARLTKIIADEFNLIRDRSVYYCSSFALRFSSSARQTFSNTVLSLSNLRKYDDLPFIVCLVTPDKNYCFLANTTFLKKISHSSHELRENNIRGSFNGSDIVREFEGIPNNGSNIERLFAIHAEIGFEGNLARLVEATNQISPIGSKYKIDDKALDSILEAPSRAKNFISSPEYSVLKAELDLKVEQFKNEILLAALIENVNVRGRVIEYLIAGEDESLRQELIEALRNKSNGLPQFSTANALGDYQRTFANFETETDVKTKIMILNSNPKAYNLDKMLEFLSLDRSVFLFYFVGVDPGKIVNTVLVSMFQSDLLQSTIILRHWSGRNSRGVTQFEGKIINNLLLFPNSDIEILKAIEFLEKIVAL